MEHPAKQPIAGSGAVPDAPPRQILISPTRQCVYQCRHCDRHIDLSSPDLPILLATRALTDIRSRFGPRWVTIAGGEPLMWAGALDTIAHCKLIGHDVNVMTNGALLTPRRAAEFQHWGLDAYNVSLDGFREVHDRLRQPGAYDAALASLELMRRHAPDVHLGITCVVHRDNVPDLARFVRFCLEQPRISHMNIQAFISHYPDTRDRQWYLRHPLWPADLAMLDEQLDELADISRESDVLVTSPRQLMLMKAYFHDPTRFIFERCVSWSELIIFNNNGDIAYCSSLPPVGNLHEKSFNEIWDSEEHAAFHRNAKGCRTVCHFALNCATSEENIPDLGSGAPR